jgi:hypothetical protein
MSLPLTPSPNGRSMPLISTGRQFLPVDDEIVVVVVVLAIVVLDEIDDEFVVVVFPAKM